LLNATGFRRIPLVGLAKNLTDIGIHLNTRRQNPTCIEQSHIFVVPRLFLPGVEAPRRFDADGMLNPS
jgi:hypothetical protein